MFRSSELYKLFSLFSVLFHLYVFGSSELHKHFSLKQSPWLRFFILVSGSACWTEPVLKRLTVPLKSGIKLGMGQNRCFV